MSALSVVSVADRAGFHVFATALRTSTYASQLEGPGPFTVFAPSDAAFGALSKAALDQLLHEDNERLQTVLDELPPGLTPKLAPVATGLGEIFYYSLDYSADAKTKPATREAQPGLATEKPGSEKAGLRRRRRVGEEQGHRQEADGRKAAPPEGRRQQGQLRLPGHGALQR